VKGFERNGLHEEEKNVAAPRGLLIVGVSRVPVPWMGNSNLLTVEPLIRFVFREDFVRLASQGYEGQWQKGGGSSTLGGKEASSTGAVVDRERRLKGRESPMTYRPKVSRGRRLQRRESQSRVLPKKKICRVISVRACEARRKSLTRIGGES